MRIRPRSRKAFPPTATKIPTRPQRPIRSRTPNPVDDPGNSESHEFKRKIQVQKDGLGKRKVKVEFVDANGLSVTPVTDAVYGEDDSIHLNFTYFGKKITLRVYYNDQLSFTQNFQSRYGEGRHEVGC